MSVAIREKLAKCADLPSMPAVAIQILDLCQRDEPDMGEIAKLIGSDPALSAKILRLDQFAHVRPQVPGAHGLARHLPLGYCPPFARWPYRFRSSRGCRLATESADLVLEAVLAVGGGGARACRRHELPAGGRGLFGRALAGHRHSGLAPVGGHRILTLARPGIRHATLAEGERASCSAKITRPWALGWPNAGNFRQACARPSLAATPPSRLPGMHHADIAHLVRLVAISGEVADVWIEEDAAKAMKSAAESSSQTAANRRPEAGHRLAASGQAERRGSANYLDVEIGSRPELSPSWTRPRKPCSSWRWLPIGRPATPRRPWAPSKPRPDRWNRGAARWPDRAFQSGLLRSGLRADVAHPSARIARR
jgi:hypothetical protein